jgi:hypothetical protein
MILELRDVHRIHGTGETAVPWVNVAVALVAVPVIAMLGAGLLTRSRLPIERRL